MAAKTDARGVRSFRLAAALSFAAAAPIGCGASDNSGAPSAFEWRLPPGFPEPFVPPDNALNNEKVELGRRLFYDKRLSVSGEMSCSSCHEQSRAFTDGMSTPTGATGQHVPRNSMTLTNAAYAYPFTWSNPGIRTLEDQALIPMFNEAPIELGLTPVVDTVLSSLQADPTYAKLFPAAFPVVARPFQIAQVVGGIASFERTLISGNSPFDRWQNGDESAVSAQVKLGFDLFNSERFECYHCHTGLNFTSAFRSKASVMLGQDYQNDGLYNLDAGGSYPPESPGLIEATGDRADAGKFRIPSLRNVAVTAPYMHDGSIPTLEAVLDHYAAGGRLTETGPNAGDGRANIYKSAFVRGFTYTPEEAQAMLALLNSLTDDEFLTDERFSDPWRSP